MIKLNYCFDKSSTYLLACSFGPDSMCLFDLLRKNKVNFVVCHVNYHKRAISNLEEYYLKKICDEYNIKIEILDTSKLVKKGNFQNWARNIRYSFFKECYEKYNAIGLFVAHQQDDLIETYLMQKERCGYFSYYGIKEETIINEMNVIRPLLSYTKKELQEYDNINNVSYSLDVSNNEDVYKRNFYRHNIVNKLNDYDRKQILKEISFINEKLNKKESQLKHIYKGNKLDVNTLKELSKEDFSFCIIHYLENKNIYIPFSCSFLDELYKNLFSDKSNIEINLNNKYYYYQEYGEICVFEKYKEYCYKIPFIGEYKFDEFDLCLDNDSTDRNITENDYPLTIRNAKKDDKYLINGYEVSLRRLFIDYKMPKHLRNVWPVILNKDGKIIYVPRYRKTYVDNHKTLFKIKLF